MLIKIHINTLLPIEKKKNRNFSKTNKTISFQKALNKNVIASIKKFKIISYPYRKRYKNIYIKI